MKKSVKKQPPQDAKTIYLSQVITDENITRLATETAKKALRTIYQKSLDKTIASLLQGIRKDKRTLSRRIEKQVVFQFVGMRKKEHRIDERGNQTTKLLPLYIPIGEKDKTIYVSDTISDGQDIIHLAIAFYCEHKGVALNTACMVDTKGKDVSVYTACLRALNRFIVQAKKQVKTQVDIQDLDENSETYCEFFKIPQRWDIPTITDLRQIKLAIDNMKLSATEHRILSARLRGYSLTKIAETLGINRKNITTYLHRIQAKATAIDIKPRTQKDYAIINQKAKHNQNCCCYYCLTA